MFYTIFKELKNKKKNIDTAEKTSDKLKDIKKIDNNDSENTNKKKVDSSKKKVKNKKPQIKKKTKKNKKTPLFGQNKSKTSHIMFSFLSSMINSPQFILLFIIFVVMLCNTALLLGSKTVYLNGHYESYSETQSIFIPDFNKLNMSNNYRDYDIGDIIYLKYNNDTSSWDINIQNKSGLRLEIIDKNDYFIFTKIQNLDNTIIDTKTLNDFDIYNNTDISVPIKHSFNNYQIYHSLNDAVNVLRTKFNISE